MDSERIKTLRVKIAELTEQLAGFQTDDLTRHQNNIIACIKALELAIISLAIEIHEEIDFLDLMERDETMLTHSDASSLRRHKNDASGHSADAVDSLASRLDEVEKRPKFKN